MISRTEGIVLHAFQFQENDQIFTLFSPDRGLLKLVLKGARSSKRQYGSATLPLTRVECLFKEGKGELLSCREIAILDPHLLLRESLDILQSACLLLTLIQKTQWPGKEASEIYQLLKSYLTYLPKAQWPQSLVASFRLKLLKHEGLLTLDLPCSECREFPSAHYFSEGETYCASHAPADSLYFSNEETHQLRHFFNNRSLKQLDQPFVSPSFPLKVEKILSLLL